MNAGNDEKPPNQGLDLTIPGAAQSVILPLCLLSGLAAQAHVGRAERAMDDTAAATFSS